MRIFNAKRQRKILLQRSREAEGDGQEELM
jgi:hypothetical protein